VGSRKSSDEEGETALSRPPLARCRHQLRGSLYICFSLSLRDIEELLLGRGAVSHTKTIRCRCDKFGAGFARRCVASHIFCGEQSTSMAASNSMCWCKSCDKAGRSASSVEYCVQIAGSL
jgi:hypothetical protein